MENSIIWDKCILCQDDSTELLQCPAESLPLNKILNEANDIEHCLITHKARWHKSCNSKFNTSELKTVQKRLSNSSLEDVCAKKYTRKNVQSSSHLSPSRFFCNKSIEESKEPLHSVSTMDMDNRVRQIAADLQEET